MMGTLTVKEHLEFVAELRLPSSLHYDHKMTRVNEVLEELGIEHIANSKIGTLTTRGISGGERRRLAIASELITDPPILFLDEV
jgi:ATP-binding cassette subfamily G (WHITE) protein 2